MSEYGELLELRREAGGLRYYLFNKPIHAGDIPELQLDDGRWVLGRYEWNYRKEDLPWFVLDNESGKAVDLNPERSLLRWPERPQSRY